MVNQEEEDRATLFRVQENNRVRNELARERALRGNEGRRKTNYRNWEPVQMARRESSPAGGRDGEN